MCIKMKVNTHLTIDHVVKKKAMLIIQKKMHSTLSREVENFLRELIKAEEKCLILK